MSNQAIPLKRTRIPSPVHISQAGAAPKKKVIVFGWYGGKFSHLNWLLPLLPACHHYCEPFAGSAPYFSTANHRRLRRTTTSMGGGKLFPGTPGPEGEPH